MPTTLKGLKIKELSLVRRPANQGAESLLHKSDEDGGDTDEKPSLLQKFVSLFHPIDKGEEQVDLTAPETMFGTTTLALHSAVESIMEDDSLSPTEKLAKFEESIEQYRDAVIALPTFPAVEITDMQKSEEVLKAEAAAAEAITKAQQEKDAAVAELQKFQEAAKAGERKNLAKSLVEKTNVKTDDVEVVLKAIGDDEAAVTALKNILGKNGEAMKDGKLLEEIGKTNTGDPATPAQQLQKSADDLRTADPKLTPAQAMAKALEQNPELYEASLTPASA